MAFHPGLGIPDDGSESIVIKHFPDSFLGTDLHTKLQSLGSKRILWMGMITWMCVDTTVRTAKALGYHHARVMKTSLVQKELQ